MLLQRGNALGADHAAVGDDADAADAKTSAQSVDDRQQGGDIGGVAGPQLAAQRPAVLINDQPDDHLMEVGDELYDAKIRVLGEMVKHHIKEEEEELFPELELAKMDLKAVGKELAARKEELMSEMQN